jgi:DNA-directed RNA polymerase specialized sigma24 family protein
LEQKISKIASGIWGIYLKGLTSNKLLYPLFSESRLTASAWEEFLIRYSKLILKIIWVYSADYDDVMEKYVQICTKLSENNFLRLKKFQSDYSKIQPKFSTWLTKVINNLCIDIYRKSYGRKRYPAGIKNLPKDDRLFFELFYLKSLPLSEVSDIMNLNSNGGNESADEKLTRIESLLIRNPRSSALRKQFVTVPFDESKYMPAPEEDDFVNEDNDNYELYDNFEKLIEHLSVQEKIVIRLRFRESLSAKEISDITKIKPYQRVYSILGKALKSVRKQMEH